MSANLSILIGLVVAIIAYSIGTYFYQRKIVKTLKEEEFRSTYRKAQIIDVRDDKDFQAGHILGARNIPLTQLQMRYKEIRNDQPVYLYDQNGYRSGRAAQILKKKGYNQLFQLQGGFKAWTGKVKS
ncbi:rhodanese-like domain-containing protein [Ectobacillus polymachus]|uniref:rhodanese-like domain-containing protein n=1 Tax=Ectobacillus polymachus TaxID=1508806 RepID=UPI003A8B1820